MRRACLFDVKKSEHACAVPDCGKPCPREYPVCTGCWYAVPLELRRAVRAELARPEPDEEALRDAVARAVASVEGLGEDEPAPMTEAQFHWQLVYMQAGSPKLEEKRKR